MLLSPLFAGMPASSSYQLNNYGFGSGGTSNSTSTNYRLNATTGEQSNVQASSTNYSARSGNQNTQQANVPAAPTFTNPASHYNRLRFIISQSSTATDYRYSIAVSSDNWATTRFVQLDNTLGTNRVFQTYALWGGASGQYVTGLSPSTTYQMRVNAMQSDFTEGQYGPAASAATVAPQITFDIDVAATDIETSPPYAAAVGTLLPNTVVTSTSRIWVDLATNAESGALVYVSSQHGGLRSSTLNTTITSATADLSVAATGYGAQIASVAQASGGPLTAVAPYNGSTQNVGILNTVIRELFSTTAPITSGRGSFTVKGKASGQTPAAGDYQDTLTLTTAGIF